MVDSVVVNAPILGGSGEGARWRSKLGVYPYEAASTRATMAEEEDMVEAAAAELEANTNAVECAPAEEAGEGALVATGGVNDSK